MLPLIDFTSPHWAIDLSNELYHADKTAVSSTSLRRILKSQRSFFIGQTAIPEETNALRFGSAIHTAILEPEIFKKTYVIMPKFNGEGSMKKKADWRLSLEPGSMIL